jgi:uncharacterized membrane protein
VSRVQKSIDVNVPIRTVYDQWTQFEEFPRFMDGVTSVRQLDDTRLHWSAEIAGRQLEWDAQILEQRPDELVSWASTTGSRNAGTVTFERLADDETRVTVLMEVDPEGALETIGEAVGVLDARIEGDMQRFKEFIESRGAPTGAWRGTVAGGEPRNGESPNGSVS